MKNTKENAEHFLLNFGKSFVDKLEGIPDFIELLTEYGKKLENQYIPNDAHSFEVFTIKDNESSPTGKEAFIGYKLDNGDFYFIGVPFTEPKNNNIYTFTRKELINMFNQIALWQKARDYQEAGHFLIVDEEIEKPKIIELLDSLYTDETIVYDNIIEELIEWNNDDKN